MCGIAGYVRLDGGPAAVSIIRRMTDAIAHRGPDGEGFWVNGPVALGHRRLAIIDLTDGGRQPMQTEDGRWTITYNGELYNYAELRALLRSLGVRFHSASDTEVLLRAVAQWGLDALNKFNGMFAFALWDAEKRELHLARDRFGIKPLYWMQHEQTILFGSEIKAILAHPGIGPRLDLAGLREYLTFQNFYTERTLFSGISLLPGGAVTTVRLEQGRVAAPVRYHQIAFREPDRVRSTAALADDLDHLFAQAVGRQLVADVEVGSYLSGGIDSAAITAIAAAQVNNLRTFTCGFDLSSASGLELYYDERREAEMVSAHCRTEHYEMVLKAGDMERIIPKLVWHLEEPRVGQCYPNFYISGLASKFNKVVLAGTGGDEIFGGYVWRYHAAYGASATELESNAFRAWQRLFPPEARERALAPASHAGTECEALDIFRSVMPKTSPRGDAEERLNAIMTFEANTFLRGLLIVEDKVAMAHGLEARVPFLDNDLVDFACLLPVREKLRLDCAEAANNNYSLRRNDGKRLLRRVVARLVPDAIAARDKQGFSAPDASWFMGQSIDYVKSRIGDRRAKIYQFVDYETTHDLLDQHFQGVSNHRLLIWSLIYLEQAFETWKLA